jgi:hypothetical protein
MNNEEKDTKEVTTVELVEVLDESENVFMIMGSFGKEGTSSFGSSQ